jgi:tetratricopeptide (TPR) repeat protein
MTAAAQDAPATIDEAIEQIETVWEAGDLDRAGELILPLVEEYPEDARAWLWLGNWRRYEKDYESAIEAYDRAIELDPTLLQAYTSRWWPMRQARGGEASDQAAQDLCDACADAIAADPTDRDALYSRSWGLYWLGDFEAACADLRQILETDPEDLEAMLWLANLLGQMAPGQAEEVARDAFDLAPEDPDAISALAFALDQNNKPLEALEMYERLREIKPEAYPYGIVASIYWRDLGDIATAMEICDEAIEQRPERQLGYAIKVSILLREYEDGETALTVLEEAVEAGAPKVELAYRFGRSYELLERWQDAADVYTLRLDRFPDDRRCRERRAEVYYELGRYEEAWRDVHRAQDAAAEMGSGWAPDEEFLDRLREAMPEPERNPEDPQ